MELNTCRNNNKWKKKEWKEGKKENGKGEGEEKGEWERKVKGKERKREKECKHTQSVLKKKEQQQQQNQVPLQGKKSPNKPRRREIAGYTHSFLCWHDKFDISIRGYFSLYNIRSFITVMFMPYEYYAWKV